MCTQYHMASYSCTIHALPRPSLPSMAEVGLVIRRCVCVCVCVCVVYYECVVYVHVHVCAHICMCIMQYVYVF